MTEGEHLVLLRLSAELSTKARGTRRRFMRQLAENLRDAMRTTGREYRVESQWNRLFVRTKADADALGVLGRVPGISSYSVVVARCRAEMDEIIPTGVAHFGELVRGRTYAVRARRSGSHPFSSSDVMHQLGAALNPGAKVDLDSPDVEVEVEVRDQDVYLFSGRRKAFGGLPLGVEGRAVCLISGGFDSAVAAWMMLKRGVELDYVFCNLAGEAYERSVVRVTKILADDWSYGTRPSLHVVDFGKVLDDLRASSQPRYWQLVLKRLMYRTADRIAREVRAQAIITGEAIGQVSSQTLSNLAAIDRASGLPVFRPLLGFDKGDIVDASRRIGTFDISAKVKEYCAIAPGNPVTSATPHETEVEEKKLDPAVLRTAVEGRHVLDLRGLREADLAIGYLFTDDVPDDAVVLDIRSEPEWEAWHYPGSMHRPSWELTANPRSVDRDRTYVLYCDQGMQAAHVAEVMQREGIEAYAFRGGTAELRRRASEQPPS
jgi:tRNA uracil 4-sulfurtransferase